MKTIFMRCQNLELETFDCKLRKRIPFGTTIRKDEL